MELARGCMRNLIGCVLSASQSGVANNRGPRIKCVGAAYLFCEFQSITAATSLSGPRRTSAGLKSSHSSRRGPSVRAEHLDAQSLCKRPNCFEGFDR